MIVAACQRLEPALQSGRQLGRQAELEPTWQSRTPSTMWDSASSAPFKIHRLLEALLSADTPP